MILKGKNIVLGVTGGIAAYKAVEVASRLVQGGAKVDVVMTPAAKEFVTPLTFQAITHRPVTCEMFTLLAETEIGHVSLAQRAELLIIAPLTANTLAKLAWGLADNMLTATALSTRAPLLLAPAMETQMWENPQTQENLARLLARGAVVVGPEVGRLASGAFGAGRMAEPEEIVEAARAALGREGPLAGRKVVITAGGTQEPLDPVRILTNRSSGRMGLALARAARDAGAQTTLIHAPMALPIPWGMKAVPVISAQEMCEAVLDALDGGAEVLVMAAAVADYRPAHTSAQKIKKEAGEMTLHLERTPDILATVAERRERWPALKLVTGFAADTEDLVENALQKLRRKNLDLIVANDPRQAIGAEASTVIFIDREGRAQEMKDMPKEEVAEAVIERMIALL